MKILILLLPVLVPAAVLFVMVYVHRVRRPLGKLETSLLTAAAAIPLIAFGALYARDYRFVLFLLVPFLIGFVSVLLYSRNMPERSYKDCFWVTTFATLFTGIGLVLFAIDGMICVLMASPLAFLPVVGGGSVAWSLQRRFRRRRASIALLPLLLLGAPLLMGAEMASAPQPEVFEIRTPIVIDAPPEVVWKHVVSFRELPPPKEWIFRAGVGYPVRTDIDGSGVGAARRCVISTGAMPETVEVWDEPRLLRFSVQGTPSSMRELSPWGEIHPPHLEGFFTSLRGQFRLVPLPGGRTLVEGTSWYRLDIYPAGYWRLWSDWIIHRIHFRVLEHVKELSEGVAL